MSKTHYSEPPVPVLVDYAGTGEKQKVEFTITINAEMVEGEERTEWIADTRTFWLPAGELDTEAVRQNPAAYFSYVALADKQAARDKAQQMVDDLRNGRPVVPVPSFRAGAAVCNRTSDQMKLAGGLLMGGLEVYELADGELVQLTRENLQGILKDVAAWEVRVQMAKQTAWQAIDAATSEDDVKAALMELESALR